jgi:glycerol uptake facilitator protein
VQTGLINPAVSLAAAVVGDITWTRFAVCVCAQMLGGLLGGFLVWVTYIPHFQPLEFVESTENSTCDCCDLEANGVAIIKQELSEPAHR